MCCNMFQFDKHSGEEVGWRLDLKARLSSIIRAAIAIVAVEVGWYLDFEIYSPHEDVDEDENEGECELDVASVDVKLDFKV